ncbi:MAG: hypothetical protein WAV41_01910 [Microgenomates group bacterium]
MIELINATRTAIVDQNYYLTLFICLTMPDIAGKIEYPNIDGRNHYIKWFNENVADKYIINNKISLTGNDCYALRCSMLHEGVTNTEPQPSHELFKKFVFGNFESHKNCFFDCNFNGVIWDAVIQLSVRQFCLDMCDSAQIWLERAIVDDEKKQKIDDLVIIYPAGNSINGMSFG